MADQRKPWFWYATIIAKTWVTNPAGRRKVDDRAVERGTIKTALSLDTRKTTTSATSDRSDAT